MTTLTRQVLLLTSVLKSTYQFHIYDLIGFKFPDSKESVTIPISSQPLQSCQLQQFGNWLSNRFYDSPSVSQSVIQLVNGSISQ